MAKYQQPDWEINLPADWQVEEESDYHCFYAPQGVGQLIISSFQHDQAISDDELEAFAEDHLESEADAEEVEHGDFTGFTFCYSTEDEYLCEWYLKSGSLMLFITYSCALEDEEQSEEDIVETILDSLRHQEHV